MKAALSLYDEKEENDMPDYMYMIVGSLGLISAVCIGVYSIVKKHISKGE